MIGLIFAQSGNGYIGKDGQLLFQIPEDMKRFKELTSGSGVVMGRRTWDSIPEKFKPLPNRENFVLSRNGLYLAEQTRKYPELRGSNNLLTAMDILLDMGNTDVWIIGGESLYEEGMKYADVIHQTLVTRHFDGDAKAPVIDENVWVSEVGKPWKEHNGLYYQFNTYKRKVP